MNSAISSEWVKIRRSVLVPWGTIAMVVAACLTTALTYGFAGTISLSGPMGRGTSTASLELPSGVVVGLRNSLPILGIIVFALAYWQMAAEYEQGTLGNLLIRQPRRSVLLRGKFVAFSAWVVGALTLTTVTSVTVAFVIARQQDVITDEWTLLAGLSAIAVAFVAGALGTMGFAILGMSVAIVFRSSVIAFGVVAAYLILLEPVLSVTLMGAAGYLPGRLLAAAAQGGTTSIDWSHAWIGTMLYMAIPAAVAAVSFVRRDMVI